MKSKQLSKRVKCIVATAWAIMLVAVTIQAHAITIKTGRTKPGETNWQIYQTDHSIYVDIDTSSANFRSIPLYFPSIGGYSNHWDTIGANSVYSPTPTGFRIYLKSMKYDVNSSEGPLTPELADEFQWHINWIGMEE